jgi:hypothetical protein
LLTDLINVLPGNSSVNTVQHAAIDEVVFSMSSAPNSGGTTGFCNLFLSNGSVNTFKHIGPCYESGDVINNRVGVFRGACAECLYEKGVTEFVWGSYESVVSWRSESRIILVPRFQSD